MAPTAHQRGVPGALNSRTTPSIPAILCGAACGVPCLPTVPVVVMMSPVSMRMPVVSSMIISALSVAVVSPTHDHGRWDDHDRGRSHDDWDRSHDDRHPAAHGDI